MTQFFNEKILFYFDLSINSNICNALNETCKFYFINQSFPLMSSILCLSQRSWDFSGKHLSRWNGLPVLKRLFLKNQDDLLRCSSHCDYCKIILFEWSFVRFDMKELRNKISPNHIARTLHFRLTEQSKPNNSEKSSQKQIFKFHVTYV